MDMEILSNIFELLNCPSCNQQCIKLSEQMSRKKGMASLLLIYCTSCEYKSEFYTSTASKQNSFDVNKRIIYTMRACGQGYAGLEKFIGLINMPKPMTAKNYDKIV